MAWSTRWNRLTSFIYRAKTACWLLRLDFHWHHLGFGFWTSIPDLPSRWATMRCVHLLFLEPKVSPSYGEMFPAFLLRFTTEVPVFGVQVLQLCKHLSKQSFTGFEGFDIPPSVSSNAQAFPALAPALNWLTEMQSWNLWKDLVSSLCYNERRGPILGDILRLCSVRNNQESRNFTALHSQVLNKSKPCAAQIERQWHLSHSTI